MNRSAWIAAAALALALALAPASAGAASPFSAPLVLSPPGSAMGDARMSSNGDLAVVWQGSRNLNADRAAGKVEAVTAAAGAGLRPVQHLASGDVRNPQVALGEDGRVSAIWATGTYPVLGLATGTAGGGFGAAQTARPAGMSAMAIGPEGHAVAVWNNRSAERHLATQLLAAHRPPGGDFGPATVIAEHGYVADDPVVAVDARGAAVVAWKAGPEPRARWQLWTATISPQGAASAPVAVSAPEEDAREGFVRIAANRRGDTALAWRATSQPPSAMPVVRAARTQVAVRPAGGRFGPAQPATEEAFGSATAHVAVGPDGSVLAAWAGLSPRGDPRAPGVVRVARRPPGGAFGPVAEITAPRANGNFVRAGVDAAGNEVVAWAESAKDRVFETALFAAARRPGGAFGRPVTLAERGDPEALVFDGHGRGALLARLLPAEAVAAFPYDAARLALGDPAPRLSVARGGRALRYRLPHVALLNVAVDRIATRRCRRCVRHRRVSRLSLRARPGTRRLALRTATRRRLARGSYRAVVRVEDLAGRRLAQRRLRFRVGR